MNFRYPNWEVASQSSDGNGIIKTMWVGNENADIEDLPQTMEGHPELSVLSIAMIPSSGVTYKYDGQNWIM